MGQANATAAPGDRDPDGRWLITDPIPDLASGSVMPAQGGQRVDHGAALRRGQARIHLGVSGLGQAGQSSRDGAAEAVGGKGSRRAAAWTTARGRISCAGAASEAFVAFQPAASNQFSPVSSPVQGHHHPARLSTSKPTMLRVVRLNSTPIRWTFAPRPRYFSA
jgi:hypothetical protein